MVEGRREGVGRGARRRLTVAQAADQLGTTVDAVRGRIKRRTIAHEREGGRVYVLLDADEPRQGRDQDADQPTDRAADELRDRLRYVEGQLQAERQAHAEARRLLLAALERIPAIEAPTGSTPDAPGPPSGGEDTPGRGETPGTPETPAQRPSWWRRFWR